MQPAATLGLATGRLNLTVGSLISFRHRLSAAIVAQLREQCLPIAVTSSMLAPGDASAACLGDHANVIWRRSTVPNTVAYGAELGRLADFLRAPELDSAMRLIVSRRASQRAATLAIARAARSKCSGRTE